MKDSKSIYTQRVNLSVDYIQSHLDTPPSLEKLAKVAGFSSFHFHRLFRSITGETVNFLTNRLRLEKAARLLNYSTKSITDIALDCGFSPSSTLSRSFKQYFGTSPSTYRKSGVIENSKICKELFPIDEYIIPMSDAQLEKAFPVKIIDFPSRRVAFIRVVGGYQENRVLHAFSEMVDWAKKIGLYETETIFGMSIDDPLITPQENYRYEVCLTLPDSVEPSSDSIVSITTVPKCKYAVTRISGDLKVVATASSYLYKTWLIHSSYEPEHQHGLEIFLDKENVCNWNHFDLDLCLPIKPLQRFE